MFKLIIKSEYSYLTFISMLMFLFLYFYKAELEIISIWMLLSWPKTRSLLVFDSRSTVTVECQFNIFQNMPMSCFYAINNAILSSSFMLKNHLYVEI